MKERKQRWEKSILKGKQFPFFVVYGTRIFAVEMIRVTNFRKFEKNEIEKKYRKKP